jgi:type II secretory pathway component GspD/PulD (secretin)
MPFPRRRLLVVTPLLAALCALPLAAEEAADSAPTPDTPPAAAAMDADRATPGTAAHRAAIEADARYTEALAQFRIGNHATALRIVREAVLLDPGHEPARALRREVEAILGDTSSSVGVTAERYASQQAVAQQELVIRLSALRDSGMRKMEAGDFAAAELDFDRIDVAIRASPDRYDWGPLPAEIAGLRREARIRAESQALRDQSDARQAAVDRASAEARLQEDALEAKVDELLARGRTAYDRKDFRRAEIDAWNAYDLDRRREDARQLYLDARRAGHVQTDRALREESQETRARVHEEIHRALIPQSELLLYPEDWQRRNLRTAAEIGSKQVEAWRQAILDRLEQRITVDFEERAFEEVVAFLRQVTGANIIVSPTALALNPPPVTLKVKDMKFGDALKWILELTKLQMAIQDQAIFINDAPVVGAVVLRMYDVTDLTMPIKDFPGRETGFSGGGGGGAGGFNLFAGAGGGGDGNTGGGVTADELIAFIQDNVGKGTWDPAKGTAIEARQGSTLFVTQIPEIHGEVARVLTDMRNRRALQVNIDIRMLEVRKGYFEEIGVEYHNSPIGYLDSNGGGYRRLNNTISYAGDLYQALPAKGTETAYDASVNGPRPRGMVLESSLRPFNFFNTDQVNLILSAVEEETDATVLQNPNLTCFNNQRANAAYLLQFSYIADYDIVGNNLDARIEVLSFGNTIDVKPIVSQDRKYITMEVNPTATEFAGSFVEQLVAPRILQAGDNAAILGQQALPVELPNLRTRALRSTARLPNRASMLVGGYANALRQRTHSGIPFLSHIPFLGRLFSRNGVYDENRQIFYMVTGRVLELGGEEAQQ